MWHDLIKITKDIRYWLDISRELMQEPVVKVCTRQLKRAMSMSNIVENSSFQCFEYRTGLLSTWSYEAFLESGSNCFLRKDENRQTEYVCFDDSKELPSFRYSQVCRVLNREKRSYLLIIPWRWYVGVRQKIIELQTVCRVHLAKKKMQHLIRVRASIKIQRRFRAYLVRRYE